MKKQERMLIIIEDGLIQTIYSTIDLEILSLDNDVFAVGDGDFDNPIQPTGADFEVVTLEKFNRILKKEKKRIKDYEEL